MNTFPPSHFAGWIPKLQYDYHKKWNEEWATDERFEQLGNTFAGFLQNGVSHLTNQHRILQGIGGGKRHKLGDSGLFITGNAAMVRGSYTYKRFVRIGSEGYHPNALQMFIECYTGGTPFDASPRDDSDLDYDKKGKQGIKDPTLLKEYILNIYKTMMLRGIRGTYIYVCDKGLRSYVEYNC